MEIKDINIGELKEYIECAFEGDFDLINFFDKGEPVKNIADCAESVFQKIKILYPDSLLRALFINNTPIGYFAFCEELLVSFGINIEYRKSNVLDDLWSKIKDEIGENFKCVLYSHNKRAIGYLQKCGMKILFDSVTVLQFTND